MQTTAILNLKGGVGKTTTVIHMAAILAKVKARRVLVIDCDSQASLSEFLEAKREDGTLTDALLNGDEYFAATCIQKTPIDGVDILAADDRLMELDLSSIKSKLIDPLTLRRRVELLAIREEYDNILIDCPPAFNASSAAALMASDDVVIPIKIDAFSLTGMANVMRQIFSCRTINPRLRVAGLLPTMWYKSEQIRQAGETLWKSEFRIFHHSRRSKAVDDLTFSREVLTSSRSGSEIDYRIFVDEWMGGAGSV